MSLKADIEAAYIQKELSDDTKQLFHDFKDSLNRGHIRAAEKKGDLWIVNPWVKMGILLGFRLGVIEDMSIDKRFRFYDKSTFPLKNIGIQEGVRIVPGGSSIRDGSYMGTQVTCMPPMYVNVGAYVDDGTMIDSHALVGSCAQIGKNVHLSAGSQIGGVLEPIGSMPVIIEDDVLIGGNCGIYEGTLIRERAIIGAGTILTGGTPVYDLVRGKVYKKSQTTGLEIPSGAVVVPGSRPIQRGIGADWNLSIYTPIIIKYRDEKTETSIALEELLR